MGVFELCGIIAAITAGLGGPFALFNRCGKFVIDTVSQKVAVSDEKTRIVIDEEKHKTANLRSRMDSLEHEHFKHVERTIRLESNLLSLEKGQERIEHQLDTMKADSEKARAEIIDSIRELRNVKLKY